MLKVFRSLRKFPDARSSRGRGFYWRKIGKTPSSESFFTSAPSAPFELPHCLLLRGIFRLWVAALPG
jgi:hypothetical protein